MAPTWHTSKAFAVLGSQGAIVISGTYVSTELFGERVFYRSRGALCVSDVYHDVYYLSVCVVSSVPSKST